MRTCTCGDAEDEHGGDLVYPGSTACNAVHDGEECECVAFEDDGSADPGEEE